MGKANHFDHVRISSLTIGRIRSLITHRRRRVRDKWAGAFIMSNAVIRSKSVADVIVGLRRVHECGYMFTPRGMQRLVRALNKCGHRVKSQR